MAEDPSHESQLPLYWHDCCRRVQVEHAGRSPGHLVFFRLECPTYRVSKSSLLSIGVGERNPPTVSAGLVRSLADPGIH